MLCRWTDATSVQTPTSYDLPPITNEMLMLFPLNDYQLSSASDLDVAHMMSNINLTCEPPLFSTAGTFAVTNGSTADSGMADFIDDTFDDAVPSRRAAQAIPDNLDYGTTLSTTMEYYSSASAALNDDLTQHVSADDSELAAADSQLSLSPANCTLTDTNALFQQLLRANLFLDELDYDNSTFPHCSKCVCPVFLCVNVMTPY